MFTKLTVPQECKNIDICFSDYEQQNLNSALTGMAQLVGHCPANWKISGSIPSQGICLGFGFHPW